MQKKYYEITFSFSFNAFDNERISKLWSDKTDTKKCATKHFHFVGNTFSHFTFILQLHPTNRFDTPPSIVAGTVDW